MVGVAGEKDPRVAGHEFRERHGREVEGVGTAGVGQAEDSHATVAQHHGQRQDAEEPPAAVVVGGGPGQEPRPGDVGNVQPPLAVHDLRLGGHGCRRDSGARRGGVTVAVDGGDAQRLVGLLDGDAARRGVRSADGDGEQRVQRGVLPGLAAGCALAVRVRRSRRRGVAQEGVDVASPVAAVTAWAAVAAQAAVVAPGAYGVVADPERGGRLGEAEPVAAVRFAYSHGRPPSPL